MSTGTSPLLSLCRSPAEFGRVIRVMTNIIDQSFVDDNSRRTQAEAKRRSFLCIELFTIMRRDAGYSVIRTLDNLSVALRARLDGAPWEPSKARAWSTPEDENNDRSSEIWTPERARLGVVE